MQNKSSRAFTANGGGGGGGWGGGAGAFTDKRYVIEKFAAKPAVFHRATKECGASQSNSGRPLPRH